jgi:hypothetical protein
MSKILGRNKYQKAAHRPGEVKVDRQTVAELIKLSCSSDVDERLTAAKYLCPCHVQTRIDEAWAALYRMMEDEDRRVRHQAWHALEDGGVPNDPTVLARLQKLHQAERDPKVRDFAWMLISKAVTAQEQQVMMRQQLTARSAGQQRGKCDFCGQRDVWVTRDLNTAIPTASLPRAAWVCAQCAVSQ